MHYDHKLVETFENLKSAEPACNFSQVAEKSIIVLVFSPASRYLPPNSKK